MLVLLLLTLGVFLIACGMYMIRINRAQQANVANFMYSLTHDSLSNPIQSAKAATENLERDLRQTILPANKRLENTVDDLKYSLDRLSTTAHNLRHLALLEIDQNATINERINLVFTAQSLILELGHDAEASGVRLLYEGKSKAITVLQQPEFVRNILKNVLQNAIKYTVGSADACVILSISEDTDSAIVVISDNGAGISETQLKSLTRRPQRPIAMTVGKAGAGLGLYLVQRLVDQCNGTLDIRSEVGKGTVVTINLPVVTAAH